MSLELGRVSTKPKDCNTPPKRFYQIDVLRGFAALAVAWFHFTATHAAALNSEFLVALGHYGWLGVQVFFVISGFVIPYVVFRSPEQGGFRFFMKRMIRLTPPYWLAIIVVIGLVFVSAALPGYRGELPEYDSVGVLSNFLYSATLLGHDWVNPVFWSLAIEFQYYLLIAISIRFLSVLRIVREVLFVLALLSSLFVSGTWIFAYSAFFAAGFLVFYRQLSNLDTTRFIVGLMLTLIAAWYRFGLPEAVALALSVGFLLLNMNWHKSLIWLGGISYSLYLIHVPVGGRIMNFAGRVGLSEIWVQLSPFIALAISILASWVFCLIIERPAIRWSRQFSPKKP